MTDELDDAMVRADAMIQAGDPRGEQVALRVALERRGIVTEDDYVFSPLPREDAERALALLRTAQAAERADHYWRRGIPEGIRLTNADLDPRENLKAANLPELRRLGLSKVRARAVERLKKIDVSEVISLRLDDVPWDDAFEHLVSRMPELRELSIVNDELFDVDSFQQLLDWPGLARLHTLALEKTAVDDPWAVLDGRIPELEAFSYAAGRPIVSTQPVATTTSFVFPPRLAVRAMGVADAIVNHPGLTAVRDLALDGAVDDQLRALARRALPIERLSITNSLPSADTLVELVNRMPLVKLAWVAGERTRYDVSLARTLAAAPSYARLRELALDFANLGDEGAEALAASPHLANVRRLSLVDNWITKRGRDALRDRSVRFASDSPMREIAVLYSTAAMQPTLEQVIANIDRRALVRFFGQTANVTGQDLPSTFVYLVPTYGTRLALAVAAGLDPATNDGLVMVTHGNTVGAALAAEALGIARQIAANVEGVVVDVAAFDGAA